MAQINIEVKGDKETIAKLRKIEGSLKAWPLEFNVIGRKLAEYFSTKPFMSEGGVFGALWPDLTPGTAQAKVKEYPGRNVLVRTGKMQDSFGFNNQGGTMLTIFNTAEYFKYHQSDEPRRKLPRRVMIGINEEVKSIVREELEQGVRRRIKNLT